MKMMNNSSMALLLLSVVLFSSVLCPCSAAVFKVGDAVEWTIGKINYTTWASKKTFHVGDTLEFLYNNTFHNVLVVNNANYKSCTAASPIAKYTTGNDYITIKSAGDHYFLCGVPGHCLAGQKLEISALAKGSSAAPSASPAPAPSPMPPTAGGGASSPSVNSGSIAPVTFKGMSLVVFTLAVAALMVNV